MAGRSDLAARKRAVRGGRDKGCRLYIPAEALEAAGIDPNGPVPWYRVWPGERGRFIVQLFKDGP
jgi:hypothetical protein